MKEGYMSILNRLEYTINQIDKILGILLHPIQTYLSNHLPE
ncbi:hypothetical protein [Roseofilum capinflatum]|uniref:Uncharacterized protein n=1 Tax=Roseofilum capinflatum BLCC-M114 TaxID=3022440 RepID=A0ABT7B2M3_9CYAN|nr:hypothetical protein [Roseofilum capinflatum]MDJ1173366.1 hypothetical protein [Roseofilum capinflatum BLCC-M114]